MQNPDDLIARARKYLAALPESIEGQKGHDALFRAATVLAHGYAFDDATALDLLREYNLTKCSPPWDEKHLTRKIAEAGRRAHDKPKGWLLDGAKPHVPDFKPASASVKISQPPKTATLADLPPPASPPVVAPSDFLTFTDFLFAAFRPDEQVQIETPADLGADGKGRPAGKGIVKTATEWNNLVNIDPQLDGGPAGSFVRINPVKDADGKDASITAFRHVLLEWDTGTKEEQRARIARSQLPVTAIVDSGGKSVHAWVRVDAKDRAEYDARVSQVFALFADCPPDKQNKNPSRFTRLPCAARGDKRQALIDINQGLPSWEAWTAWKGQQDDAVQQANDGTEVFDLEALDAFDPNTDPTVLVGKSRRWLCKGYVLQIVGFSGSGKSSLAMQMCVQWARGLDLFGLQPVRPLRIVICQAENDFGDTAEAYAGSVRNLTTQEKLKLKDNLTIVRNSKAIGPAFPVFLKNLVERHKPDIVLVDPLLAYAGFDIADQALTTDWLRNQIFPIVQSTGIALIYMHHTTKPKSADDLDSMTPTQLAYLGAGCSEWVNFARDSGYLFRTRSDDDTAVYKFGFSKRQSRCGLQNSEGRFTQFAKICHSPEPGVIRWQYAVGDSLNDQTSRKKPVSSPPAGSVGRFDMP